MLHRIGCGVIALVLAGCASAGSGDERVPVYTSVDDVPCEYEVLRTVRARSSERFQSAEEFIGARRRLLGRAGKRAGADAVLVEDLEERGARAGVIRAEGGGRRSGAPDMPSNTFEGQAIRFVEGTCKRP